jgi:hypothetical protein
MRMSTSNQNCERRMLMVVSMRQFLEGLGKEMPFKKLY